MVGIFKQIKHLPEIRILWFYLYLLRAVLSGLLILPIFMTVNSLLSVSGFSRGILTSWDMSVIVELVRQAGDSLPALIMIIFIGALIYLFLMQFINGGMYYLLVSGRTAEIDWRQFFAEGAACFGQNMRISLLMIVIYLLLIPSGIFFVNILNLVGGNFSGTVAMILTLIKFFIILMFLLAASIFSDSARAAIAVYPDKTFKEIIRISSDYFRPRIFKLMKIFLITFVPFFIIWMVVEWLAIQATGLSLGIIGVFLEFILFQIAAFSHTGQKLWYLLILGRSFRQKNPGRFLPSQVELNFDTK